MIDPQERLAADYRERTAGTRAWLVVLLGLWLVLWVALAVMGANENMLALGNPGFLAVGIVFAIMTLLSLIPLLRSPASAWRDRKSVV